MTAAAYADTSAAPAVHVHVIVWALAIPAPTYLRAVILTLAGHADANGVCRRRMADLCADCMTERTSLHRALTHLQEMGVVERQTARGSREQVLRLRLEADPRMVSRAISHRPSARGGVGSSQHVTARGVGSSQQVEAEGVGSSQQVGHSRGVGSSQHVATGVVGSGQQVTLAYKDRAAAPVSSGTPVLTSSGVPEFKLDHSAEWSGAAEPLPAQADVDRDLAPPPRPKPRSEAQHGVHIARVLDAFHDAGIEVALTGTDTRAIKECWATRRDHEQLPGLLVAYWQDVSRGTYGDQWLAQHLNVQQLTRTIGGYEAWIKQGRPPRRQATPNGHVAVRPPLTPEQQARYERYNRAGRIAVEPGA